MPWASSPEPTGSSCQAASPSRTGSSAGLLDRVRLLQFRAQGPGSTLCPYSCTLILQRPFFLDRGGTPSDGVFLNSRNERLPGLDPNPALPSLELSTLSEHRHVAGGTKGYKRTSFNSRFCLTVTFATGSLSSSEITGEGLGPGSSTAAGGSAHSCCVLPPADRREVQRLPQDPESCVQEERGVRVPRLQPHKHQQKPG